MKIRLLIEPQAPGLNVFDQARLPRLGLPLLGHLLTERGHDVRIYVETLASVDWADVAEADLVGFSSTTATTPVAFQMAGRVRDLGIPLRLLWRERGLRLQLPRVALLSLFPSRRPDVLDILRGALSRESWKRLQDMLVVPVLRLYGRVHIWQWMRQARSRAYVEYLRRFALQDRASVFPRTSEPYSFLQASCRS